jgi:hypothetical protein
MFSFVETVACAEITLTLLAPSVVHATFCPAVNRFLSCLVIVLIAAFLVGRSGVMQALGSSDDIQLSDRGEVADDGSEGDVAITSPGVTLPPPGPQGRVESMQTRPVTPALIGGIFRPPCSLRA